MWFIVQSEQLSPQKLNTQLFPFVCGVLMFCDGRKKIIGIKKD
jgi:hypothetical protein